MLPAVMCIKVAASDALILGSCVQAGISDATRTIADVILNAVKGLGTIFPRANKYKAAIAATMTDAAMGWRHWKMSISVVISLTSHTASRRIRLVATAEAPAEIRNA